MTRRTAVGCRDDSQDTRTQEPTDPSSPLARSTRRYFFICSQRTIFLSSTVFNGTWEKCRVPYAVNNRLVKLVLSATHPFSTGPGPPATPFPVGTGGGAWPDMDQSVLNDDSERRSLAPRRCALVAPPGLNP